MQEVENFRQQIVQGIPEVLPSAKPYDTSVSHAPKRKDILQSAHDYPSGIFQIRPFKAG